MNIYEMTDTWNDAGTDFTGIGLDVADTNSGAGSKLMDLKVGGTSRFSIAKGASAFFEQDLLEIRRGSNPQRIDLYHSYTDNSNYERASLSWNSNVLEIGTAAAGTGSAGGTSLTDSIILMTNLPTSDPTNAGQLWNDAGTLKVSAG